MLDREPSATAEDNEMIGRRRAGTVFDRFLDIFQVTELSMESAPGSSG